MTTPTDDWTTCALEVQAHGPFDDWKDAWATLPTRGRGWVMAPDVVVPFDATSPRRFLAAEVAEGPHTSAHVRFDGSRWRAWRYIKREGDTHQERRILYAPVRIEGGPSGPLEYAEYWALAADPLDRTMRIWTPCVTRFLGFTSTET